MTGEKSSGRRDTTASPSNGSGGSLKTIDFFCFSELLSLRGFRDRRRTPLGLGSSVGAVYNFAVLRRREFAITDTELKLMAAAAIIGLKSSPKNG